MLVCAFTEVDLIWFRVFSFLYYEIDYFVVLGNMTVLIIEILQTGKKLSFARSEIIAFAFEALRVDSHAVIESTPLHLQYYVAVAIYEVCVCLEFPDDFWDTYSSWNRKTFDMLRPKVHVIHRVFWAAAEDFPASL